LAQARYGLIFNMDEGFPATALSFSPKERHLT
jgi:hypothetical protein